MEVGATLEIPVTDESQVGDARRQVLRLAQGLQAGETESGRLAVVATELAANLVRHTPGGGEILVRAVDGGGAVGIEIMAVDRGPGMEDVARCLRDGYSTRGTSGTGLGAVSRMSDLFQLHSTPALGTVVLARVWTRLPERAREVEVGVLQTRKPGQEVCGDGWALVRRAGGALLMVVDGLGHGPGAAEASLAATRALEANADRPLSEIVERAHAVLRPTRGAALALAGIDLEGRELRYVGVGNISGVILTDGGSRSLISHNGIVGHELRKVQEFVYPFPDGSTLVMHSDGVATRWDLGRYPGLGARHPSLLAGVLYRDFARGTDDATVVALRAPGTHG